MNLSKLSQLARPLIVGAALALLGDLFLDWHRASVQVPGIDVTAGAAGFGGWGIAAAILIIVLAVWEVLGDGMRRAFGAFVLATVTLAFTIAEFASGKAHVNVANVVGVSVDDRLWPAYVGLTLAASVVVGSVIQLAAGLRADVAAPRGAAHGTV